MEFAETAFGLMTPTLWTRQLPWDHGVGPAPMTLLPGVDFHRAMELNHEHTANQALDTTMAL